MKRLLRKRFWLRLFVKFKHGQSPLLGIWIIGMISFIAVFIMPLIMAQKSFLPSFHDSGPVGDTFNGIAGPFIAIGAAILTYLAFWKQHQSNLVQTEQFKKSDKDTAIQRFENKFYIMLDLHRQNVNEITIYDKIQGRKSFYFMFKELRFAYFIVKKYCHENDGLIVKSKKLTDGKIFQTAYLIFFFGIGPDSSLMVEDLLEDVIDKTILRKIIEEVEAYQNRLSKHDGSTSARYQGRSALIIEFEDKKYQLGTRYKPFNGHMSRLSHYIRHIYQTVKFVDDQPDEILSSEKKYEYITNLRAQLSVYEQLIIYYNALSVLGRPWMDKDTISGKSYFEKYGIVKSIPLPLADFYKRPLADNVLPKDVTSSIPMFEWTQIKERLERLNDQDVVGNADS